MILINSDITLAMYIYLQGMAKKAMQYNEQ